MKEALLHYRKDVPPNEKTFHANEKGVFSRLYDLPHIYKKRALIIKFKVQTSMFKVQTKKRLCP
ncbi:hypothetical protein HMPREF9944_00933 [Segatella maculosa OT 289]|uniref:Uncharacterized protein n=1 Tax=Segatella maculosa OT 289 TaxID=999422 RepID=H1HL89_9BACT|nr:hypothetical protein HMPREF9944_00933 [Segatella maculosa OT 289]